MTCSFSEFQNVCINKSEHESKSRQRRCDMSILVGMLRVMAENQLPQTVPLYFSLSLYQSLLLCLGVTVRARWPFIQKQSSLLASVVYQAPIQQVSFYIKDGFTFS